MKVEFPYNDAIADKIRQIPGSVWSRSLRAWLIPFNDESLAAFHISFPDIELTGLKKEVSETFQAVGAQNLQPPKPPISPVSSQPVVHPNGINLEISPKQIWVKMPKDEIDIQLVRRFLPHLLPYRFYTVRHFCMLLVSIPKIEKGKLLLEQR